MVGCRFVRLLCVYVREKAELEGGRGWSWGRGGGHYPQQGNIELAQTNSHSDP